MEIKTRYDIGQKVWVVCKGRDSNTGKVLLSVHPGKIDQIFLRVSQDSHYEEPHVKMGQTWREPYTLAPICVEKEAAEAHRDRLQAEIDESWNARMVAVAEKAEEAAVLAAEEAERQRKRAEAARANVQ